MTAAAAAPQVRTHGNAYEIFILVLTVMSLIVMALVIMPLSPATHETLLWFDNAICFVFLADFLYNITGSQPAERVLHPPPGLAGPAGLDPDPRLLPVHRPVPPRPAVAAGPDHAAAQRAAQAGADRRHHQEPRPVRAVRVAAADVHRPDDGDGPRAPVRVPLPGREHRHRRRRAVVGVRHADHGRLRRLLPRDHAGPHDRRRRDGGRHRPHRRARHPSWPASSCRRPTSRPRPRPPPAATTRRSSTSASRRSRASSRRSAPSCGRSAARQAARPTPSRRPTAARRRPGLQVPRASRPPARPRGAGSPPSGS